MRNRIVKVTEVVVRSAFYIISNYVFVSMGLSLNISRYEGHRYAFEIHQYT